MSGLHPVIALSGVPGAGKSRAGEGLAARIGATFLPYDAFETLAERDVDAAMDWLNRGAPIDEMFDPALDATLRRHAEQGPVVLETPLGRLPPGHADLITCAIWIEVDRDIALSRKLAAVLAPEDWNSAAELAAWLAAFLDNYATLVRPCLQMQAERVRPLADHIVDGMAPGEVVDAEIARIVMAALAQAGAHQDHATQDGPPRVGPQKDQTGNTR